MKANTENQKQNFLKSSKKRPDSREWQKKRPKYLHRSSLLRKIKFTTTINQLRVHSTYAPRSIAKKSSRKKWVCCRCICDKRKEERRPRKNAKKKPWFVVLKCTVSFILWWQGKKVVYCICFGNISVVFCMFSYNIQCIWLHIVLQTHDIFLVKTALKRYIKKKRKRTNKRHREEERLANKTKSKKLRLGENPFFVLLHILCQNKSITNAT